MREAKEKKVPDPLHTPRHPVLDYASCVKLEALYPHLDASPRPTGDPVENPREAQRPWVD
jgi:hypothetical protein